MINRPEWQPIPKFVKFQFQFWNREFNFAPLPRPMLCSVGRRHA